MHVQLYVRGIESQVQLWKIFMQCQYFKWRRTLKKTGEEKEILIQAGLRPSVLGTYEIIIPRTALPTLLSMMCLTKENIGVKPSLIHKTRLAMLRRICGVKKISKKIWDEAATIPNSIQINESERGLSHLYVSGVAVHLIGIKEDADGEMFDPEPTRKGTYIQEML